MAPTTPVNVRIASTALTALEALGQRAQPMALNRSEMINVAIAEYVRNHAGELKQEKPKGRAKGK